jgi:dihydroxyacetone kinase
MWLGERLAVVRVVDAVLGESGWEASLAGFVGNGARIRACAASVTA